jgi:hypothetical protein
MLGNRRRPALPLLGALLALAAGFCCAPPAARASCGDYVVLDHRPASPAPAVPAHPCHGPSCSRGSLPPLVPLTTAPSGPDRWGHLDPPPVEPPVPSFRIGSAEPSRPTHHPAGVYHPPRPARLTSVRS